MMDWLWKILPRRFRPQPSVGDIVAKQRAIANNPLIIEYERARRWNGQMPTTMLGDQTGMRMQLK